MLSTRSMTLQIRTINLALFMALAACCHCSNAADKALTVSSFSRRTIYHSPQTPGYTCWVGAWIMPDQSLMVTFKQATGPLTGRARSEQLLTKMGLATL